MTKITVCELLSKQDAELHLYELARELGDAVDYLLTEKVGLSIGPPLSQKLTKALETELKSFMKDYRISLADTDTIQKIDCLQ